MRFRALGRALIAASHAIASAALAQGLLLPAPDERLIRDCDVCPTLVTLPSGLLMSQAPVTRGEFAAFVADTGFQQGSWGCKWNRARIPQEDTHPVVCVSFNDAMRYVDWMNQRTGKEYRLPTLAEMRFAALGGQTGNYWWGQSVGRNRANCVGCGSDFDGIGTSPVGTFEKSPFHIQDAVGNVWVWTSDCVQEDCASRYLVGGGW